MGGVLAQTVNDEQPTAEGVHSVYGVFTPANTGIEGRWGTYSVLGTGFGCVRYRVAKEAWLAPGRRQPFASCCCDILYVKTTDI